FIEVLCASVEVAESAGKASFQQPPSQLRRPVQGPLIRQENASGQIVAVRSLAGGETAERARPRRQVRRPGHVRFRTCEAHPRSVPMTGIRPHRFLSAAARYSDAGEFKTKPAITFDVPEG